MSTTALPPNLSPAYQPRSFRGVSPYPAPPAAASSSSHKSGSRSVSAHRLEHPLPSRPTVPLPSAGPAPRLNAEPISGASTSASSSGHRVLASPAIGAYDERRGRSSGLRNEVKRGEGSDKGSREEGEVVEVSPEIKRAARDILKLFRKLPAPLPEFLPSTYLPEQAKKKKSTTPEGSFSEYVRSQRRATSTTTSSSSTSPHAQQHPLGASESSLGKRRRSSSPSNNRTPNPAVGLGLGLEMPIPKKSKSTTQLGSTAMTPSSSLPLSGRGPRSPELLRTASTSYVPGTGRASTPTKEIVSGYRPRAGSSAQGSPPSAGESKATWPRPRWGEAAILYAARAMKLKRHGDAHLGLNAKPEFAHLVRDDLLGLLCYTDAVLLWLYSYWADEQSLGRVRGSPYSQSQALRDFVRASWERYGREQAKSDREKEMVKGMIGLMYLIEAVIFHHLATQTIAALGSRTNHLVAASSTNSQSSSMNRAANGSTSAPAGASTTAVGPSPASTNDASPPNSLPDPSPHSASSTQSPELSAEISGMISSSSSQHHRASQYLLNSRHHLPISRLRKSFPSTYDVALHSELADEALPAPNDALGAARKVDIDQLDTFIWPIELGMCAPGAHLSVFGRRLVEEFAKAEGKDWDVRHG